MNSANAAPNPNSANTPPEPDADDSMDVLTSMPSSFEEFRRSQKVELPKLTYKEKNFAVGLQPNEGIEGPEPEPESGPEPDHEPELELPDPDPIPDPDPEPEPDPIPDLGPNL